jgi:hypothetical protein
MSYNVWLLVDSAGVVPVRNLQLTSDGAWQLWTEFGPCRYFTLVPTNYKGSQCWRCVSGILLYVVRDLKMGKFSFHNCRFVHFMKDCQILLHLNHSVTYKQYEWIVMLSVLIVLSWWHWRDICEETAVPSDKQSTREVSTGSECKLWWAAAVEVSEILIRGNVT